MWVTSVTRKLMLPLSAGILAQHLKRAGALVRYEEAHISSPSPMTVWIPITVALAVPIPRLSCLQNISSHGFPIPSLLTSNGRVNQMCLGQPSNKRPHVTVSDGFQLCRNY